MSLSPWNCDCLTAKNVILLLLIGLVTFYVGHRFLRKKKKQYKRDTVILHQLKRGRTIPNISPFCLKLETYIRIAKIPHEVDTLNLGGPNKKVPWISYNDDAIPDSTLCIDYLNNKFNVNLNAKLSSEQLAIAHTFQILVDEHLVWCLALHRYVYDERKEYLHSMDWNMPIPNIIFDFLFKMLLKRRSKSQGIGMHSREVVTEFAKRDLKAISNYLGDKSFLFGSEISEADCAVFGMVAQLLYTAPTDAPFKKWFDGEFSNLKSYCVRMKERAFPDWNDCLQKP